MLIRGIRLFLLIFHLQTGAMSLTRRCMCSRGGNHFSLKNLHASVSRLSISSVRSLQSTTEEIPEPVLEMSAPSYLDQMPTDKEISTLHSFLRDKKNILVISGAGISTSSGVPDYRGPLGSYKRGHKPMIHSDFMNKESSRKRYWARSMVGWKDFANARPNAGHYAIANLEMKGIVSSVITQNVDRLHHTAGSRNVIELHGRNDRVVCSCCGCNLSRKIIQHQIESINPYFLERIKSLKLNELSRVEREGIIRADGDTELGISDFSEFVLPECSKCGTGILKPDVVFFGDSVPKDRVQNAFTFVDQCDGLLVVGTSLEVYSAYRFLNHAANGNKQAMSDLTDFNGETISDNIINASVKNEFKFPIAICNIGETRAERMKLPGIVFKSEANCAKILGAVVDLL